MISLIEQMELKILSERGLDPGYLESTRCKEESRAARMFGFTGRLLLDSSKSWEDLVYDYGENAVMEYFGKHGDERR